MKHLEQSRDNIKELTNTYGITKRLTNGHCTTNREVRISRVSNWIATRWHRTSTLVDLSCRSPSLCFTQTVFFNLVFEWQYDTRSSCDMIQVWLLYFDCMIRYNTLRFVTIRSVADSSQNHTNRLNQSKCYIGVKSIFTLTQHEKWSVIFW